MPNKNTPPSASVDSIVHTPVPKLTDNQWAFLIAIHDLWPSEVWFKQDAYGQTQMIRSLAELSFIYPRFLTMLGQYMHRQNVIGMEAVKRLKAEDRPKYNRLRRDGKKRFCR